MHTHPPNTKTYQNIKTHQTPTNHAKSITTYIPNTQQSKPQTNKPACKKEPTYHTITKTACHKHTKTYTKHTPTMQHTQQKGAPTHATNMHQTATIHTTNTTQYTSIHTSSTPHIHQTYATLTAIIKNEQQQVQKHANITPDTQHIQTTNHTKTATKHAVHIHKSHNHKTCHKHNLPPHLNTHTPNMHQAQTTNAQTRTKHNTYNNHANTRTHIHKT